MDDEHQLSLLALPETVLFYIIVRVASTSFKDWINLAKCCTQIRRLAHEDYVYKFVTFDGLPLRPWIFDPEYDALVEKCTRMRNPEINFLHALEYFFAGRLWFTPGALLREFISTTLDLLHEGANDGHGLSVYLSCLVKLYSADAAMLQQGFDGLRFMRTTLGRYEVRRIRERVKFLVGTVQFSQEKLLFMIPFPIQCEHTYVNIRKLKKWTVEEYEDSLGCSYCLVEFDLRCILDDRSFPPAFYVCEL